MTETERIRTLTNLVRSHVSVVLGHSDPSTVDPDCCFQDLGCDSLTALELRNRLTAATGLRLPTTIIFDYPSTTTLANWLSGRYSPSEVPEVPEGSAVEAMITELERAVVADDVSETARTQIGDRLRLLVEKCSERIVRDTHEYVNDSPVATHADLLEFVDQAWQ
jgi:polyketide synthase 12